MHVVNQIAYLYSHGKPLANDYYTRNPECSLFEGSFEQLWHQWAKKQMSFITDPMY